jgi:hypothetical protein
MTLNKLQLWEICVMVLVLGSKQLGTGSLGQCGVLEPRLILGRFRALLWPT